MLFEPDFDKFDHVIWESQDGETLFCVYFFFLFVLSLIYPFVTEKKLKCQKKIFSTSQRCCTAPLCWSNYTAYVLVFVRGVFAWPEQDSLFKTTKDSNKEIYSNLRRKIIQSVKVFCSLSILKISGLCFKNLN